MLPGYDNISLKKIFIQQRILSLMYSTQCQQEIIRENKIHKLHGKELKSW